MRSSTHPFLASAENTAPENSLPLSARMTWGESRLCTNRSSKRVVVARDRALHVDGDRFVRWVIQDHKTHHHSTFGVAGEHEVHRLRLVSLRWSQQRLTLAHGFLFSFAPSDLQLLLAIQPLHALVVHEASFLSQCEIAHRYAIAVMAMRQRKDARAQLDAIFALARRLLELVSTGSQARSRML